MTKEVDYSIFEGREIKHYARNREVYSGVVFGCDFDIGITIVDKYSQRPILCLRGQSIFNIYSDIEYKEIFNFIITLIRDGITDSEVLDKFHIKLTGFLGGDNPTKDNCPFY
jgi:hypothetical protein